MKRQEIFQAIKLERSAQDKQWGGPLHDKTHGEREWFNFIFHQIRLGDNLDESSPDYVENLTKRYIKIAALAVAAIEAMD